MFGLRKKYDFEVMTLEITSACPCRCKGCYYFMGKEPHRGESMDSMTYRTILDKTPLVRNLILSGGEPMVHQGLKWMLYYAHKVKIKPTILTSGAVMPSEKDLELMKPHLGGVVVTVKYPDRTKDANWKGIPEDRDHALYLLEKLQEMGIKRHIHWVVDRMNEKYWDDMKALAKQYKASLEILRFLSFDKSLNSYQMTPGEFFRIRKYPDPYCPAGVLRFNIDINGGVSPCIYSGKVVGNILLEEWDSIKRNLYVWRELKGGEKYRCFADLHENRA